MYYIYFHLTFNNASNFYLPSLIYNTKTLAMNSDECIPYLQISAMYEMFLLLLVIDLYHNKTFGSLSVNVENVYTPFEVEIEWRRGRVNGFSWGRYIKEELKSFINAWLLLLVERYISVPGLLQVHSDTDLSTSGSKSFILNHHNIAITCSQSRTEHLHKKVTVFTIRWGKQLSIHPQTRPGIRHQSFNEYHFLNILWIMLSIEKKGLLLTRI